MGTLMAEIRGSRREPYIIRPTPRPGITPALAVISNAIIDALAIYGIEHIEMPATAANVWAAMRAARERAA